MRVRAIKKFAGHHPGDVFNLVSHVADAWIKAGLVEELKHKPAPAPTPEPLKAPYEKPAITAAGNLNGGEPAKDGEK